MTLTDTAKMSSANPMIGRAITIDGPAASGKGTLAKNLAKHYKMKYLDTGAVYRATAYSIIRSGGDPADVMFSLKKIHEMDFDFRHVGQNKFGIFLSDEDITDKAYAPHVGDAASIVATTHQSVREALMQVQEAFAAKWRDVYGVLLDGRDCGARICPTADIKFFLVADAFKRAERRYKELAAKGIGADLEELHQRQLERDARDKPNTLQTDDAIVLDATSLNIEQILALAVAHIDKA